jgi:TRAP-type mannitol/chloroaromatic compound transport system permease small subunit
MQALLRLSRLIDRVIEWIGNQLIWIVTLMIAVGFLNVVARYLGRFVGTRLTSNAVIEAQWYMFTLLFFFGFAYILKHNLNVRVDFLYAKFTPKQQALVDTIGHVLFFVAFCVIGIYVTYGPVMASWGLRRDGSWGTWELSPDPDGLPRAPIKSMIIVAFILLLLQTFSEVVKNIGILFGKVDPSIIEHHASREIPIE